MTDHTTAQLATILSALAGTARKPATKAAAMKAIDSSAAALGLSTDAVLAAAPGLLGGRLDPVAWREQLTASVQSSQGERIAASLSVAFPELPAYLEITASGEQAMLIDRRGKATVITADSDDAAAHASWRRAIRKLAQQHATADILPCDQPAPPEVPQAEQAEVTGSAEPSHSVIAPRQGTKQALLVSLLGREQGATLDELIAATGWLPHTSRAALTDLRRRGYILDKDRRDGGQTAYRISTPTSAAGGDGSASQVA
jgi:hypothetical protein